MSTELKPCPFCGSKAKKENLDFGPVDRPPLMRLETICCSSTTCGALVGGDTLEEAVKTWNTRPIEDRLQSLCDQLAEALELIKSKSLEIEYTVYGDKTRKGLLDGRGRIARDALAAYKKSLPVNTHFQAENKDSGK